MCYICFVPQLHLYVPDETARQLRARAAARGLSVSKYLAQIVQRELATGWPRDFFDDVAGGWEGEPLERPEQGAHDERDDLER